MGNNNHDVQQAAKNALAALHAQGDIGICEVEFDYVVNEPESFFGMLANIWPIDPVYAAKVPDLKRRRF